MKVLHLMAVGLFCGLCAQAAVRYVDPDATGNGDGSSWANAHTTLNAAIASGAADEIWVKAGSYDPGETLTVTTHTLYGGFDGTETALSQRDREANETIITGAGTRRIFSKTAAGTFTLDGFTVKDGLVTDNTGGGSLSVSTGDLTIRNSLFTNNLHTTGTSGSGGAIRMIDDGAFVLSDSTFVGNKAQRRGGGIFAGGSVSISITNCTFLLNEVTASSSTGGGALWIEGSSLLTLTDSRFETNKVNAHDAGAIRHTSSGTFTISGCDFIGNVAGVHGSAIYASGGGGSFSNCTFELNACNTASSGRGGTLALANSETVTLIDCRFWTNNVGHEGAGIRHSGTGDLFVYDSEFIGNYTRLAGGRGGAVVLARNSTATRTFSNCVFVANSSTGSGAADGGGALWVDGGQRVRLFDCRFEDNIADGGRAAAGGAILVRDSDPGNRLEVVRCDFTGNWARGPGGAINSVAPLATNSFVNCSFVANRSSGDNNSAGGALQLWGNSAEHLIINSTFFTNTTSRLGGAVILGNASGTPILSIRNSIFWINAATQGGNEIYATEGNVLIDYTSIDTGDIATITPMIGAGVINENPLFASETEPYDVHLKSRYGRWDPGAQAWVINSVHNPCIAANDPASDFSREPRGNGGRINLGCYGNTPEASKGSGLGGTVMIIR